MTEMYICLTIFAIAYFLISVDWFDKTLVSMLGATIVICTNIVPFGDLLGKIDLNVLALLIGMMIILDIMSQSGVFEYLAIKLANIARGNGMAVFAIFMFITAFISALLDNVTTVILLAPITILICQFLEITAIPFLIMEAIFSNIGGTATLIGDPPNVIIGSICKLSFNDFLINLTPLILVIGVASLAMAMLWFKKMLKVDPACRSRLLKTKPELAIVDKSILHRSLPVFVLVILGFFFGRTFHVESGVIALGGATVMALVCKVNVPKTLEKVDWSTIFFFIGLFIMIGALELTNFFGFVGQKLVVVAGGDFFTMMMIILWGGAICSALVNNIPLAIAMIPLIHSTVPSIAEHMNIDAANAALVRSEIEIPLIWALAVGVCLGGNGTLIGASANIVVSEIAKKNNYNISFGRFTYYGFPMMILSQVIASIWFYLRYVKHCF